MGGWLIGVYARECTSGLTGVCVSGVGVGGVLNEEWVEAELSQRVIWLLPSPFSPGVKTDTDPAPGFPTLWRVV